MRKYQKTLADNVYDTVLSTYQEFENAGFIHPETKEALKRMTVTVSNFYNTLYEYHDN
jgi:hypothetical protein